MTITEILTGGSGLALVVMTLIQVAPIKVNPWTAIARALGRAINREVIEKVDSLAQDLREHKQECAERDAVLKRSHIMRFGDEILHGVRHSKEHFDQILMDCTEYEQFCKDHPLFANNVAQQTIKCIKSTYQACMEEKTFL